MTRRTTFKLVTYFTLLAIVFSSLLGARAQIALAQTPPLMGGTKIPVIDQDVLQLQTQIYNSLGYKDNLPSLSLEERMEIVKKSIMFTLQVPEDDGTFTALPDLKQINKCRDAIDKIGQGSDIGSLSITAALKPGFWAGIIGGGAGEATQLSAQASEYAWYKDCLSAYLDRIKDPKVIAAKNMNESNRLTNYVTIYTNAIASLDAKITNLTQRASSGWKDIAKAVLLTTIMKVNQNVTTNLLNRAIEKYKISDYLRYADAVATQIYSMKYIDQNYKGDEEKKMVLRSLLANAGTEQATTLLTTAADNKAQQFLTKACKGVQDQANYASWESLKCLAAQGAIEANPVYQSSAMLEEAALAKVAGDKAAKQEIADSKGYAPVRDCEGSVSEQQMIDSEWGQAAADMTIAKNAEQRMQESAISNLNDIDQAITDRTISPQRAQELIDEQNAELKKATDARIEAEKAYEDLKTKRVTGNIIDICKAIASPSNFVANSLDSFLKQHLDQATQLKTENLPFFASFFSQVASNFLSKVIMGAFQNNGQNSKVVKEAGVNVLKGALPSGTDTYNSITAPGALTSPPSTTVMGANGNIEIYAYPAKGSADQKTTTLAEGQDYVLIINFSELVSKRVSSAMVEGLDTISGKSDQSNKFTLTPDQLKSGQIKSAISAASAGFTLTVTFYNDAATGDESAKKLGSYAQTFALAQATRQISVKETPPATTAGMDTSTTENNLNTGTGGDNLGGKVQGAQIILPRGPDYRPRG